LGQVRDVNAGVAPNGLFWTTEIPRDSFEVDYKGRVAKLKLRDLPLIETFQVGSVQCIPALIDCDVYWKAISEPERRGDPDSGDPFMAFRGYFAEARCVATASAREIGYAFKSGKLTADGFYASIGPEKNGVFL
jgi:hypothetical protein